MKYSYKLFIMFIILFIISAIKPTSMYDWAIENIITLAFIIFLIVTRKRNILSNKSHTLIFIYLCLHLIGSHHMYSEVPFGYWLQDTFSLARNPFDRIVHFAFGLLLAIPFKEVLDQQKALGKKWKNAMIVLFVLALGAIYEGIELFAASFMNSTQLADFVGLQGDVWDAQKDMLLAGLGAIIAFIIPQKKRKTKTKKSRKKKK